MFGVEKKQFFDNSRVTIAEGFADNYTPYNLGIPQGVPFSIGGMAFLSILGNNQLKATGNYLGNGFYSLTYNGNGSYGNPIQATTLDTGLGAFLYRPVTALDFETGAVVLITNFRQSLPEL